MAAFKKTGRGTVSARGWGENGSSGVLAGVYGKKAPVSCEQDSEGNLSLLVNGGEAAAEGAEIRYGELPDVSVPNGSVYRKKLAAGTVTAYGFSGAFSEIAVGFSGQPPAAAVAFSEDGTAPAVFVCREEAEKQHIAAGTVKAF